MRRTRLNRMSAKELARRTAENGGYPPRTTTRPSRKPIKKRNAKRKGSEFQRCFGSPERVEWVKSLPCLACLLVDRTHACGKIENAHVTDDGTKGASRRSGFRCIVPLCRGHHVRFDRWLAPFDDPTQREYVERHAERIAQRWDQLQGACAAREGFDA